MLKRLVFVCLLLCLVAACASTGQETVSREQKDLAFETLKEGGEYFEDANYEKALAAYKRALELMPDYPYTYFNIGVVYEKLRANERALDYYRKAISLKADDPLFHYSIGVIQSKERRYQDAADAFLQAVKVLPSYADAAYGAAWAYEELGKRDEALAWYRKTLVLDPYHAKAHASLGHLLLSMGDRKGAMEEQDALVGIDPGRADNLLRAIENSR